MTDDDEYEMMDLNNPRGSPDEPAEALEHAEETRQDICKDHIARLGDNIDRVSALIGDERYRKRFMDYYNALSEWDAVDTSTVPRIGEGGESIIHDIGASDTAESRRWKSMIEEPEVELLRAIKLRLTQNMLQILVDHYSACAEVMQTLFRT